MADVFDEVEEQLRSERYNEVFRRWGPAVLGGVALFLLVLLAFLGFQSWQNQQAGKASIAFNGAIEAYQQGDAAKAFSTFEQISKTGTPVYKSLSLMAMGGIRLEQGEAGQAAKYFDDAAKADSEASLADLARLKSAFATMDTAPFKDTEAKLMPLTGEKRPYRFQAKEAIAFARLAAGDAKGARSAFSALQTTLGVPDSMRERAQAAVAAIDGGSAKNLPAIIKAAAALPPPKDLPAGAGDDLSSLQQAQ